MKTVLIILLVACFLFAGCNLAKKTGEAIRTAICGKPLPTQPEKELTRPMIFAKAWPLIAVALIGIAVSVFLIRWGLWKVGSALAISFGTLAVFSITVVQHFRLIAWITGGLVLAVIVYAVWTQRKALIQAAKTAEVIKPELSVDSLKKVFGDDGMADNIQTSTTQTLISKIREAL